MENNEIVKLSNATIRLLKAVPYISGVKHEYSMRALKYGVLIYDYDAIDTRIVDCAITEYGLDGTLFNATRNFVGMESNQSKYPCAKTAGKQVETVSF